MKDMEIRIFIDENNNIEKHYCPYSLQNWSKTTQRWHDIMNSKQMYDTEIRNKTIIKDTISKISLIRHLNKKHSLIKLKKNQPAKKNQNQTVSSYVHYSYIIKFYTYYK